MSTGTVSASTAEMAWRHLFTYAESGALGRPGFQTVARAGELARLEDLEAVESLVRGHRPPEDGGCRCRLVAELPGRSDRVALATISAAGACPDGRPGNVWAETVVVPRVWLAAAELDVDAAFETLDWWGAQAAPRFAGALVTLASEPLPALRPGSLERLAVVGEIVPRASRQPLVAALAALFRGRAPISVVTAPGSDPARFERLILTLPLALPPALRASVHIAGGGARIIELRTRGAAGERPRVDLEGLEPTAELDELHRLSGTVIDLGGRLAPPAPGPDAAARYAAWLCEILASREWGELARFYAESAGDQDPLARFAAATTGRTRAVTEDETTLSENKNPPGERAWQQRQALHRARESGERASDAAQQLFDAEIRRLRSTFEDLVARQYQRLETKVDELAARLERETTSRLAELERKHEDGLDAIRREASQASNEVQRLGQEQIRQIQKRRQDAVTILHKEGDDAIDEIAKYGDAQVSHLTRTARSRARAKRTVAADQAVAAPRVEETPPPAEEIPREGIYAQASPERGSAGAGAGAGWGASLAKLDHATILGIGVILLAAAALTFYVFWLRGDAPPTATPPIVPVPGAPPSVSTGDPDRDRLYADALARLRDGDVAAALLGRLGAGEDEELRVAAAALYERSALARLDENAACALIQTAIRQRTLAAQSGDAIGVDGDCGTGTRNALETFTTGTCCAALDFVPRVDAPQLFSIRESPEARCFLSRQLLDAATDDDVGCGGNVWPLADVSGWTEVTRERVRALVRSANELQKRDDLEMLRALDLVADPDAPAKILAGRSLSDAEATSLLVLLHRQLDGREQRPEELATEDLQQLVEALAPRGAG